MATYADYTKMSPEQLTKELNNTRKSLFEIRYQVGNKQTKANHEIANLKKSVAQILTALNSASKTTKALESEDKTVQNASATAAEAAGSRPRARSKAKKAE